MATCPNCGGFLHEHHKCRGQLRRNAMALVWLLIGVGAGGSVSFLLTDRPNLALAATCALLGAVLISAFRRFAKF